MNNFIRTLKKLDPKADIKTADTTPTGGISKEVVKRFSTADIAKLNTRYIKIHNEELARQYPEHARDSGQSR